MMMDYEKRIAELTAYIADQVHMIYHKSPKDAERDFKASKYYRLLADRQCGFLQDGNVENFRRYQNEIEYGSWNNNGTGGTAG